MYLHTDAYDTGIGAYLFQLDRDGKELPIGFMSQALHDAQLRWSTFEQEAFAIHEALKKFQYILRDVQFTLRTDHRNLLLNDSGASDKVLRWKLDIQQFDFLVEHIPGEQNIVADLYSRLCSLQQSSNLPFNNQEWMDRNMERNTSQNVPPAVHWLARAIRGEKHSGKKAAYQGRQSNDARTPRRHR